MPNGVHTILARARDTSGNTGKSLPVSVTVSNTQLAGLVAAYSFDEGTGTTANDSSGQTNTAILNNGVAWVSGKNGKAASFDGVNDYITIPNSASTNISGNAITLSMWINPQPLASGNSVVIGKLWNTTQSSPFYQYGLELGGGNRTDFYVGTASGPRVALAGTTLPFNQWSYLAITFDGAQVRTYVNGTLVNTQALSATITARGNPMNIGADASTAQFYKGMLDDLRIYNRVLTQAQVQSDMTTPVGGPAVGSPQVLIDFPASGAQVGGIVNVTADASDDTGVASVQFYVDGVATGSPDTTDPYALAWDTRTVSNGAHTLTALATDVDGHTTLSAPVTVNVANGSYFQNEILATGFNLPTAIKFLPDGRMLVVELAGTIRVLPPPYTTPDPTPFLQLTNIGSAGVQQGIYDIALDPNFSTNHYYYIFYTLGTPNVDRFSRFTANATLTGTVAGSEFVIYQDPEIANAEHHGGAINFSNDGKILLTTGEHFNAGEAQDLTKPRGKILRFNMDGTVPTDNPFYDGAGPNYDAIWALGLRNPFRAYYDAPTGRLIIGDVGGNDYSTAIEEIDIGARGANYGWPNVEAPNGNPAYTAPAYYYPHNGRDAAITGGFVYHGTQFPSSYQGSYFFADYTQNWIKRLTFDANGNVNGVFNFEPLDGSVDGPYGDIVYMTEGPDGALYYVDLGYSDISGTFGVSKIRRISFVQLRPAAGGLCICIPDTRPDPAHRQLLQRRLLRSGRAGADLFVDLRRWRHVDASQPIAHIYGRRSVSGPAHGFRRRQLDALDAAEHQRWQSAGRDHSITPTDDGLFRAGDVITFSGTATDAEDGTLPASAYTWNIDFLHEGHVHPGTPITGVTSGTFTIPTTGHDFSGFTRYRITLTVTDSSGLQSSQSVTVFPDKVNLTFDTAPGGLTLYLDGIAHTAPFVYDTLIGFNHTIEARNQTVGHDHLHLRLMVRRRHAAAHHRRAGCGANLYCELQRRLHAGSARLRAGECGDAANQPDPGLGDLHECAGGGGHQYPRDRMEQRDVEYHVGHRLRRKRLSACRPDRARNRHQPGHLLRQEHQGGRRRDQYRDSDLQHRDAVRRCPRRWNTAASIWSIRSMSAPPPQEPARRRTAARSRRPPPTSSSLGPASTTGGFSAAGANFTNRIITSPDPDIAEDRFVTATGSYSATASLCRVRGMGNAGRDLQGDHLARAKFHGATTTAVRAPWAQLRTEICQNGAGARRHCLDHWAAKTPVTWDAVVIAPGPPRHSRQ